MGELDKKRVELGFWEKVFFAGLAAVFGLAGWFSANYLTAGLAFLIASSVAFTFTLLFVVVSYRKVQRIIKEIGELQWEKLSCCLWVYQLPYFLLIWHGMLIIITRSLSRFQHFHTHTILWSSSR